MRKILSDSMQKRLEIQSGELGNAMTDNERIIEKVAREATKAAQESGEDCWGKVNQVLTRTMLPLLANLGEMRKHIVDGFTGHSCAECERLAKQHDAAKKAFLEGNDGK